MSEDAGGIRVRVVSRVDCHLCDAAKEVVARVTAETGVGWEEVDVDSIPEMLAEYSDLVPVILVDGKVHEYWRVSEERLRQALTAAPDAPPWL
jgi:glutaredoxin